MIEVNGLNHLFALNWIFKESNSILKCFLEKFKSIELVFFLEAKKRRF
jgi:hypothetical protein